MNYQKLLVGKEPYYVAVGRSGAFAVHRHPEIELSYCLRGWFEMSIDNQKYILQQGDIAVVNPMSSHEFFGADSACEKITIEVGPVFLGEHFDLFLRTNASGYVFRLKCEESKDEVYQELITCLEKTAQVYNQRPDFYSLHIKSNIYKISALILQLIARQKLGAVDTKNLRDIEKIDRALNFIYNNYAENLSIETVSEACGYSKSNFCKIFRNVVGDTFHNVLNQHRIEIACLHLKEENVSVDKLSQMVGFADAKSFCRVFKKVMGETSGSFKKRIQKDK